MAKSNPRSEVPPEVAPPSGVVQDHASTELAPVKKCEQPSLAVQQKSFAEGQQLNETKLQLYEEKEQLLNQIQTQQDQDAEYQYAQFQVLVKKKLEIWKSRLVKEYRDRRFLLWESVGVRLANLSGPTIATSDRVLTCWGRALDFIYLLDQPIGGLLPSRILLDDASSAAGISPVSEPLLLFCFLVAIDGASAKHLVHWQFEHTESPVLQVKAPVFSEFESYQVYLTSQRIRVQDNNDCTAFVF